MAKLTDRQRSNILAKWHTGQFTKTELAKQYKISESMVRKICDGQDPKNSHIVEAGIMLEIAKKYENSATEVQTINNAIKSGYNRAERVDEFSKKADDLQFDLLTEIKTMLTKGKISKPMKLKNGDFDVVEQVDYDFTPSDLHTMVKAVDDAAKMVGVSANNSGSAININNANNQQNNTNNLTVTFE